MIISYSKTVVGSVVRIQVVCPFEAKDAVKASMVARWEDQRKKWTIPATRLGLKRTMDSVKKRHPNAEQITDDFSKSFLGLPTAISECKFTANPATTLAQWNPHQIEGSSAVGQLEGCLLAWDMGAGKTKGVYDSLVQYAMRFAIVCCPTSVTSVWRKQWFTHVPDDFRKNTTFLELGSQFAVDRRAKMLQDAYQQIISEDNPLRGLFVVVNYEAAWREAFSNVAQTIPWDIAVGDEVHRISNHSTRINKFMANILGPRSKRRVGLSGTPLRDGPMDAFGQFLFIEPSLYGQSLTRFRSMYCIMGGYEGRQVVDYQNLEDFRTRMATLTSRVKLSDVVQLPEFTDEEVHIELSKETKRMYAELKTNLVAMHAEGILSVTNAITKLLRLQQMTSGYAMLTGDDEEVSCQELDSAKSDAMSDIIDAAGKDEPIVVFCRFVRDLRQVHEVCNKLGRPSYEISGAGNQQAAWDADCDLGIGPVIAVQIQAGGIGIDLTKSRYCIYYSLGFSLIDYLQSRARVYRPGQTRKVIYYHLVAPGTVDRVLYVALQQKTDLVEAVLKDLTSGGEIIPK